MNDDDAYIRESIRKILVPSMGERLKQPDYGGSLSELIFMPVTSESRSALEASVREALNQRLANVIRIEEVQAVVEDSALHVTVQYVVRSSNIYRNCTVDLDF